LSIANPQNNFGRKGLINNCDTVLLVELKYYKGTVSYKNPRLAMVIINIFV